MRTRLFGRSAVWRSLATLVVITFTAEAAIMLLLPHVGVREGSLAAIATDAGALSIVCSMAFWFVVVRPLQRTLASETELVERIIGGAIDPIVTTGVDGVIVQANDAVTRVFGFAIEEIIGRSVTLLMPEPLAAEHDGHVERYLKGGGARLVGRTREFRGRRKDGSEFPLEITLSAVGEGGARLFTGILRDITARKEEEHALTTAKKLAEEAAEARAQFLATMSHEIRTPLNGVLGMMELLLDTALEGPQREYAEVARCSGEALLSLVNDILDYSKIEAGGLELEAIAFDPVETLEEVAALIAHEAHGKALEIAVLVADDVPMRVRGDASRLRQILLNLAKNAVKFTSEGEVTLRIERQRPGWLSFHVRDTGMGIREDRRHRLFRPFSQVDASTTRRFGGTGLGLAISKSLVDLMGGTIGVETGEGTGSTFWFEVPAPEVTPSTDTVAEREGAAVDLAGTRILVVDDNATNRRVFREQLARLQCRTTEAHDGFAGLAALRQAAVEGQPFQIVLLDFLMPGMDGHEFMRRADADPMLRHAAICLVTSMQEVPEACEVAGDKCAAQLTKPVRRRQLAETLREILGTRSKEEAAVAAPLTATAEGEQKRVLVAEDNRVNQLVARRMLELAGYEVEFCDNGLEAVEAVRDGAFDAVLMDCHMPEMNGFEATAAIRGLAGDAARIPIIALTAEALPGDQERCLAAGMDDYLAKPVRREELLRLLASHTRRTPRAAPLEPARSR